MSIVSIAVTQNPWLGFESFSENFSSRRLVGGEPSEMSKGAVGGPLRMRWQIATSDDVEARVWLNSGLGREVRAFGERGRTVWGGQLDSVTLEMPAGTFRASLKEAPNRVWVRYRDSSGNDRRSTKYTNQAAINRYGLQELVRSGGDTNSTTANQAAQLYLNRHSWPRPTVVDLQVGGALRSGGSMMLTFVALGWWEILGRRVYNQTTSTGDANASTVVQAIIDATASDFLADSTVATNTTQISQEYDADMFAKDALARIAGQGDNTFTNYVVGVNADRNFYYRRGARYV